MKNDNNNRIFSLLNLFLCTLTLNDPLEHHDDPNVISDWLILLEHCNTGMMSTITHYL